MSTNALLAAALHEMARLMELLGEDSFRAAAHARAARAVEGMTQDAAALAADRAALLKIEGVGPRTADKIVEYCSTGRIAELEGLRSRVPPGLMELLGVQGLGPKTVRMLWEKGGVTDRASLERIIADGTILGLPRMGAKAVEKLKASLAFSKEAGVRLPLGLAAPIAEAFAARLRGVAGVTDAAYAGSLRRGKETIGDVDVLASCAPQDAARVAEAFRTMPEVRRVLFSGEGKSSVLASIRVDEGRWAGSPEGPEGDAGPTGPARTVQVDLRLVPPGSWGAAMMYFTGSKEHNIRMRERALKRGFTLNEFGLFPDDDPEREKDPPQHRGVRAVAGATEEEVFEALDLPWIPPEIREDRGELDLRETPRLVEVGDVRAELHAHTTASDGELSIEALAERAKARGFHTIAVTDHSRSSALAGGLTVERLAEHVRAVHAARERVPGITILAGSEVDILADGSLDYPDEVLATLDIVVASPHVGLSQDPAKATARLVRAIENPFVRILGHPTGRLIDRRPGLSPAMEELCAAAREHGVALEINAHWLRLDLRDVHVRGAIEAGCVVAIDCDVHGAEDFDNLRFGVATARRGWVTPDRCVNCWDADRLQAWLRRPRGGGGKGRAAPVKRAGS